MKNCGPHMYPDICVSCGFRQAYTQQQTVPFSCPVCNGHGTTNRPPHIAGDQMMWCGPVGPFPCRACAGTGIIWKTTRRGK